MAYLRCRGLEDPGGRCPRDRELEARAWEALEGAVSGCAGLQGLEGATDVRLHFGSETPDVRFREWGESPLPPGPLSACVTPAIQRLRTTLVSPDLVLSVRVERRRR